jgi:hypothetical protein
MDMERVRDLVANADRSDVMLRVTYQAGDGAVWTAGTASVEQGHLVVDGFIGVERIPVDAVLDVQGVPKGRR